MLNKSEYFEPIDPDEKNDEFIAIESKARAFLKMSVRGS